MNRHPGFVVVALMAWLLYPAIAGAFPMLVEDFEDGVADGFTEVDGNEGGSSQNGVWAVVDEGGNAVYSQTNGSLVNGSGSRLGACSLAPGLYDSFTLDIDVRADDTNSYADAAVIFGWQDNDSYYYAMFNKAADANQAFVVTNGSRTQVGSDFSYAGGVPWGDNEFHHVALTRSAGTGDISIQVDGETIFTGTDTTYGAGRVGVGAYNDAASFDNLRIVPEPTTFALAAFGLLGLARRRRKR